MAGKSSPRSAAEQSGEVAAGGAGAGGQTDAGEKRRPRRADIGVGRLQFVLGLKNVRASLQQIRRQPGRQLLHQIAGQWPRRQFLGDLSADQQRQAVQILRHLAFITRQIGPRTVDAGLRLRLFQRRGLASVTVARGQAQALLIGGQGLAAQLEQLLIGAPGQVGVGDVGYQTQLGTAPRLLGRQPGLQRLLTEAAHPAEKSSS